MNVSCKGCVFWVPEAGGDEGTCHRRAPAPIIAHDVKLFNLLGHIAWGAYRAAGIDPEQVEDFEYEASGKHTWIDGWPRTEASDFCGEFEPRR